ncbi:hypothetical protein, partial [Prescottella equi]|uniref:hypothetical protein n=1 Tax=Rhodococcus hoagii TaxID=43767 RepID=UPI001C85FEDB
MISGRVESSATGRRAARAARPRLSFPTVDLAGVTMNAVGGTAVSVPSGAQRRDRRQRDATHHEPRSGSLAGSAATRSVSGREAPRG